MTAAGFVRRLGEDRGAFHARLVRGEADEPQGSSAYALLREHTRVSLAASDLGS